MLRALLFASLCLLPALPARGDDPAGRLCGYAFDDRVAAAKQSYSSNDGRFALSVEESRGMRMTARSASFLILEHRTSRRSQRVYRVHLDFAVTSAAVADDGRVTLTGVGSAQQYGFEGEQTLLAFLDEAGVVIALHVHPRGSKGGWQRNTTMDFFAVDALPSGVIVRAHIAGERAAFTEWLIYDRTGILHGTVDCRRLMSAYTSSSRAWSFAVMPGTAWVVAAWWDHALDHKSSSYVLAVHDLSRFFDERGEVARREPLWMARFETDDGMPRLSLVEPAAGGGVRFVISGSDGETHAHLLQRSLVGELVVEAH